MKTFPFDFVNILPDEDKKTSPFIYNVQRVLTDDLQSESAFGCKINNSHTHAGSKIHFESFIEAELLFHNGYFNQGFATLTIEEIYKFLEKRAYESVILIGYENYSELCLQQIKTTLNDENKVSCDYCIYETVVKTGDLGERETTVKLRNFNNCIKKYGISNEEKKLDLSKSLLVFVVPINTTLSTMDKMIASIFRNSIKPSKSCDNILRICLITIGAEDNDQNNVNDYWEKQNDLLIPSNDKFTELDNNTTVKTLAFVKSKWNRCNNCKDCYPENPLDEKPIFDVTRGSVVPMLQLGTKKHLKPFDEEVRKEEENLIRLWKLSKHMSYRHLTRGDNHYQYYFDTSSFLEENIEDVKKYLKNEKIEAKPFTYNYIIAPRHPTNSAWINLVVNHVFEKNDVRVLYFDITKEYRGNIKAKYSDFIRALENIDKSGENIQINFFYVDETIYTGESYLRASNLIKSLLKGISSLKSKINLFHSTFLLYGRSSKDTQNFFERIMKSLDDTFDRKDNGMKEYVHINISYMRSQEDACTLCKLSNDYYKIRKQCATNQIANVCSKFIQDHEPKHIEDFLLACENKEKTNDNKGQYTFGATLEKRLIFIITNLLNVRLNNQFCMVNLENKCQIDIEEENASDKIKSILVKYYTNSDKIFELLGENELKRDLNVKEIFFNAFVKAVSRPYFVYHVRKRQAVLSFCVEQLNKIIFQETDVNEHTLKLIKTYIKALSDINSNYLIRSINEGYSPFNKLIHIAKIGDVKCTDNKEAFCSISFVHAIKKMMSLTQDTTKSCLLENLLVNGREDEFYSKEKKFRTGLTEWKKNFLTDNKLSVYGKLYLENNRIVQEALSNFKRNNKLIEYNSKTPYYLDNFEKLCEINMCARSIISEKFINAYNDLVKCFGGDDDSSIDFDNLDENINAWLKLVFENVKDETGLNIISFVKNEDINLSKDLFQFFMLSDSRATVEKRLEFYHEDNLSALKILTSENKDFLINHSPNTKTFALIKFAKDGEKEEKRKNAIYFQVLGFDPAKINHWFAIKLFMSLRHKFASSIAKLELSHLINEKKIEMQRKALAINKAITHNNAGNYFVYDMFFTNKKDYLRTYKENIVKPQGLVPYDKYYQVLANEFISSLYRKVVKGIYWDNSNSGYEAIIDVVKNTYGLNDENLKYYMNIAVEDYERDYLLKKIILEFKFPSEGIKDKSMILLPMYGQILSISHLINLMAMNAVEHGKAEKDNYEIKIIFDKDFIMFRNKINSSDVDSLKGKLERYIKIPPWCYDKNDQHVTMWTLYHYYNLHKTKEEGFNYIEYDVEEGTNEFYIKFNIIRGEKDE